MAAAPAAPVGWLAEELLLLLLLLAPIIKFADVGATVVVAAAATAAMLVPNVALEINVGLVEASPTLPTLSGLEANIWGA